MTTNPNASRSLTMQERIDAFYLQSGGPNNPMIPKILEKHLLEGKDHGVKGRKETFQDAFRLSFLEDPSMSSILQYFMKRKMNQMMQQMEEKDRSKQFAKDFGEIKDAFVSMQAHRIESLEKEVQQLRDAVEKLTSHLMMQTSQQTQPTSGNCSSTA